MAQRVSIDRPGRRRQQLWPADRMGWLSIILLAGYLATAFAVMLGAPFWFDLLGKLMVVRSTVKPKQKSPDDPPVDGPAPAPAAAAAAPGVAPAAPAGSP